jgi:hypothetical protein
MFRHRASTSPIPQSGLSLWLKADAGVSFFQEQYISQIVISGAGSTSFNGTYIATGEPDQDGNYSLQTFDNKIISADSGGFSLYDNPNLSCYNSTNGTTWIATTSVRPSTITISNANVSDSNGTYTYDGWNGDAMVWTKDNGNFHIVCYPGDVFTLYDDTTYTNLYQSTQGFGDLPTGTWVDAGAGGTCTSTAVSFPTGAAPTGVTTTSGYGIRNITGWADQSGNSNNPSLVDSYPMLLLNSLNGKQVVWLSGFDGWNRSLLIPNNPMGANGTTAFVVNYVDAGVFPIDGEGGDANGALLGNFGVAADGSHWPYGLSNSVYDAFATYTRKNDLGLPTGINDWNTYCVSSQNNEYKIYCNGALFFSSNTNTYSNIKKNSNLFIGMQNNAGTDQIFKGRIAEIVIYNRILSTIERQQVESYLNTKYALY